MSSALSRSSPNGCAPVAASERLGIALVGAGGQGNSDVRAALKVPGVQLVGVADIYDGRLQRAKEAYCKDLFTTREL